MIFPAKIIDANGRGKLVFDDPAIVQQAIAKLKPMDVDVEITKSVATRSGRQRRYYFGVIVRDVGEFIGEQDKNKVNAILKAEFNQKYKTLNGKTICYGGSIEDEPIDVVEKIFEDIRIEFAKMGLIIPLPNEVI